MKIIVSDYIDDSVEYRNRTIQIGNLKLPWPFPIVAMLHSSAAIVFGCPVYGNKKYRWVKPIFRLFKNISEAKYWIKYRMFPLRYHWVDSGLKPGYHDPREMLLYSSMTILKRYIDEMGGIESIEEFNNELRNPDKQVKNAPLKKLQANEQEGAVEIWKWWTGTRPDDKKRRKNMLMQLFGDEPLKLKSTEISGISEVVFPKHSKEWEEMYKEFRSLEEKIYNDEQEMLHKLIDLRPGLWT